jgi:Pyridoxamine 5'-phosphate oxidase
MGMPVTALDKRFSDPKAVATSWDETRRALDEAELFWITTVRPDGRPHVTPLVAVWFDEALYFCTGSTEQKAVNLAASPHVILTTGCNRWDGGLDVVLEGDAVQVTDDVLLRRLAGAWTAKWDGRWQYQAGDGCFEHMEGVRVPVFAVRPAKVLAFAKGEVFSHTSHRF